MSLFIASLNSGSNGNCYYIGNDADAVLIDAGISCRETERRMKRLGLSMNKVKAVFISHEHIDHITGLPALSKKYSLPVYITEGTFQNSRVPVEPELLNYFSSGSTISIGTLRVKAFAKFHDAADPHSFTISSDTVTIGVFTDIGSVCKPLQKHFAECHAAFLETNYDPQMLEKGNYPFHLKKRIRGGMGHLSNDEALQLFLEHRATYMSHLLLSHLSKNNNDPKLVEELFLPHKGDIQVVVASRYKESELYHIDGKKSSHTKAKKQSAPSQLQLSLF